MSINGIYNKYDSYRAFGFIDTIQRLRAVSTAHNKTATSIPRVRLTQSMQHAMRMRKALEAVKAVMVKPEEIKVVSPARATSVSNLGLDTTETTTTVQSTEEVNTTPTSFSTHGPEWTGSSTAQASLSGEYDGSNGSDNLTFKVAKGGSHGTDKLKLTVHDSENIKIDNININKFDAIDRQYTLSNGLVFSLGEGDLLVDSSFTVDVFDSVGTAVDPDNPFNGSRSDDPNLEEGLSISDGSFEINGTTIDVNASDSINTVLDRITQSDANVSATFDAATEKVLLTQKTRGGGQDIVLGNDTSGFLSALKLEGAMPTPGSSSEADNPLAQVESFHAVQSGEISVNGTSISIDVNTDSLNDVLDRINASGAGVKASFNSVSQKVTLNSDNADSQMNLSDGATHFFSAVGISEGTYNSLNDLIQAKGIDVVNTPDFIAEFVKTFSTDNSGQEAETKSVTAPDGIMLGTLVRVIASSVNALFDDSSLTSSSITKTEGIRNNIRSAISAWSDSEGPQYDTDFGIHFDFQKTKAGVFNFSEADQRRFEIALTNPDSEAAVRNTLFGKEPNGLFNQLHAGLTASIPDSDSNTGATGLFLDIVV